MTLPDTYAKSSVANTKPRQVRAAAHKTAENTSSSAMAERPRELDQRFQMGGQFEVIID